MYFGVNSLRRYIAEAISRRMRELGDLNPSQVAKRSHDQITPAGVRNILKAESGVMVETLVIVAEALDTTAPLLLIEALSRNPDSVAAAEQRRLLEFYFDHVPPECQLDMLASAQGIYQRRNRDVPIYQRSAARATARATLDADVVEHVAPEQRNEVATANVSGEGSNVTRLAAVPDKSQGAPVVSPRMRKPVDYRPAGARGQDKRKRR